MVSEPQEKFYKKAWFLILVTILAPYIGVPLLWILKKFGKGVRIAFTIYGVIVCIAMFTPKEEKPIEKKSEPAKIAEAKQKKELAQEKAKEVAEPKKEIEKKAEIKEKKQVKPKLDLSNAHEVLKIARSLETGYGDYEEYLSPLWGVIPGKDEFEKNKNKTKMPQLKKEIKAHVYRVDLVYEVGEYNFKTNCLPIEIRWPIKPYGSELIVANYRPKIRMKDMIRSQSISFAIRNDVGVVYEGVLKDGRTLDNRMYYISIGKKRFNIKESNLDVAKKLKNDIKKVVVTFKITSGWQKKSHLGNAEGIIVQPLFIYVFGSKHVIHKTFSWPKK